MKPIAHSLCGEAVVSQVEEDGHAADVRRLRPSAGVVHNGRPIRGWSATLLVLANL